MNKLAQNATMDTLGDEIFLLVEKSQGQAFISDGMSAMKKRDFFEALKGSYWCSLATAQKIKQFLCKYGEAP